MSILNFNSFDYPFPAAISPHADTIDHASFEWAQRFQLLGSTPSPHQRALKYGRLAAHAYPRAAPDVLQIAADWISWLFFMDDYCDELELGHDPEQLHAVHERFLAVLQGHPPTEHDWHLTYALYDIHLRLAQHTSKAWLRRFSTHADLYFTANRWEATNRRNAVVPNVDTYCAARLFSGAVYACFDMIEPAEGITLPFYVQQHAIVQQLARSANNLICWCNDLLSYTKELKHNDVHNLVLVLKHEHNSPLDQAIERALAIHNAEVATFIEYQDRLPPFDPDIQVALNRYIEGLMFWVCANRDWSLQAIRYAQVNA